ncbi:MAG: DUF697 domain-containing protein [Cyanobacteria bacterium P01_F01_bin.42]
MDTFRPNSLSSKQALNLFSAKSVKFWGLSGAALTGLMLFSDGSAGELLTGLSVAGMGAFLLWNRLNPAANLAAEYPDQISLSDLTKRFTEVETLCSRIESEAQLLEQSSATESVRKALAQLKAGCDRTQLNLVITGERGVGKTALLGCLSELPDVAIQEASWPDETLPESLRTTDLTLFVAHGDLTQSELNRIQLLRSRHKPVAVILNKTDRLMPSQLETLMAKLTKVLDDTVDQPDCLAIAAAPQPITVRRHQADGSIQEVREQPQPQLAALSQRLEQRLTDTGRQQLVWQQVYGETLELRTTAVRSLNALQRQRALPLLEKYQWIAASAAFASPLPSTDMIAAAAITAKLVIDLGEIYEQRFSLNEAQKIAAIVAQALLKLGLVEISSQLLGVALKSHAATYVAGGLVQGLSVAYLTHIAGLSLIEHFEAIALGEASESQLSLQVVKQIVERVFAQNQRGDFLKGLVGQGLSRLQLAS